MIGAGVLIALTAAVLTGPPPANAESAITTPPPAAAQADAAPAAEESDEKQWEFSATLSGYSVRNDKNYLALTLTADHDWLHLEGRYNYEDLDTVSAFIGYNISKGEKFTFEFTPMVGGVTGDTDGIAPGYELTLGYKWLELYTEGEFLFDLHTSDDDYFYSWSELTVSPTDWIYGGLAAQRTKARDTDSEIELGPMLGFAFGPVELSFYFFEPGKDDQTFAASFGVHF